MSDVSQKMFSEQEKAKLVQLIREAELLTSGEIRVHLHGKCKKSSWEEAKITFEKLGMTQTREKNGILFFLSWDDHQFVILGDSGIHEKVGADFWDEIRKEAVACFAQGQFYEGLARGIKLCGEKLSIYFPRDANDQDELDNSISTS